MSFSVNYLADAVKLKNRVHLCHRSSVGITTRYPGQVVIRSSFISLNSPCYSRERRGYESGCLYPTPLGIRYFPSLLCSPRVKLLKLSCGMRKRRPHVLDEKGWSMVFYFLVVDRVTRGGGSVCSTSAIECFLLALGWKGVERNWRSGNRLLHSRGARVDPTSYQCI